MASLSHTKPPGCQPRMLLPHSCADLLCHKAHAAFGQVQLKGLPQDGIEGLPGALIAREGPHREAHYPGQPARHAHRAVTAQ